MLPQSYLCGERLLSPRISAGETPQHRSPGGAGWVQHSLPKTQLWQGKVAQALLSSGRSRAGWWVSASPEGITASWDTPERGSQGWSQSWEQGPGQGKLFFRQVMDDCPGKCEWWAQGRKGCCGRNECAVKSLFLFNLRFVKSRRITRISP